MVLIADFIDLEINEKTKSNILEQIVEVQKKGMESCEMIFNRYSIKIAEDHVIISDDIFEENEDLIISIADFIKELQAEKKTD